MKLLDINGLADSIFNGLDELFTSDDERLKGKLAIIEALNKANQLQGLTNLEEAKNPSIFVSGWRPALGWLCALLLGYAWIGRDLIVMALALSGHTDVANTLPMIDTGELFSLVFALLGLGGIRSFEKTKGVARHK
ncbi:3TM-type holin [Zooshikella sp. RANM57]|uniref:3TM-type holin n=1 Tax=Zooshikella sp. RANM57 TaxID=3425863 RepID=UPI003D6EC54F